MYGQSRENIVFFVHIRKIAWLVRMMKMMIERLYGWYGKRTVQLIAVVVALLVVVGVFVRSGATEPVVEETPLPTVRVAPAKSFSSEATVSLVGVVKAISQAQIDTELAGRITTVTVQPGDVVAAGQVLAEQENASERAAVLQAEGVYEAALAAAAQSNVAVSEAENNVTVAQNDQAAARNTVVSVYRDAYNDANTIVRNQLDVFYSNPNDGIIGWRAGTDFSANTYIAPRLELRTLLPKWRTEAELLTSQDDLLSALRQVREYTNQVLNLVDVFIEGFADADADGRFTQAELDAAAVGFGTARATLLANLGQIDTAETALANAQQKVANAQRALERAQITSSGTMVSAADAQVKQALGALRAAQANLQKTILRSPIAGTVNSVTVDAGDFVSAFTRVAEIANNDALEITTYVGEQDRLQIEVGSEVRIEGTVPGVVTSVAPGIDSETRKIAVTIAAESPTLVNGDTVTVTLDQTTGADAGTVEGSVYVPITAVKFTESNGAVFTVENNTLVANEVQLGNIRGSYVEILSGISPTTVIVLDGRGRAAGQKVEAIAN